MITLIVACGGQGRRANLGINKTLYTVDGEVVIKKTIANFLAFKKITQIIVVTPKDEREDFERVLSTPNTPITFVNGGDTRFDSVLNGLKVTKNDYVLIHDGARPYVSQEIIDNCINSTIKYGSGITAIPSQDTLGIVKNGVIKESVRNGYLKNQTPQGFLTKDILKAYNQVENKELFTDDCGIYCKYIGDCHYVLGDEKNKKLTYKEDFASPLRVGVGFDLHRLVEDRKLILGGIEIPHTKGLLGHSDADVLTHAIMDSMLSACALRDIGYYFPDTDDKYKDANSIELLKQVITLVKNEGYKIYNLSATIMAEKPKLKGYIPAIVDNIAKVLDIDSNMIGIGCTTLEGIGIVGREEGIAVHSTCSLKKI